MKNKVVILMLGVLLCSGGLAQANTWTTLDYPGASATYITGISGNNIVGYANGHGIVYNTVSQSWSTLDVQGAQSTEIDGIDGSNYAGKYRDASGREHGFLYDGSSWTIFDVPGDRLNIAGISVTTIAGDYRKGNNTQQFLYDGSALNDITLPLGNSHINGIDGSNLVGYNLYEVWHGFLYDGTTWATIDVPAMLATYPMDIDGKNIVGYFQDNSIIDYPIPVRGFLYDGVTWTTLDMPGAIYTHITGIDRNNLVGYYLDTSNNVHGFSYTVPEPATLHLLLLGIVSVRKLKR